MPKTDIDYSNTLIYKITCKDVSITDLYVGHTTNFVQRKHAHKQNAINNKFNNCKLYQVIRANGGWNNWKMEIINFFDCKDHYEARKKEQEYFESLKATLNSIEPLPKPNTKILIIKNKEKLYCKICNIKFNNSKTMENHNNTKKHKKKTELALANTNEQKESKYICKPCKFNTHNKKDYSKHVVTEKHKSSLKICEEQECIKKNTQFTCNCCNYNCKKNSEFIKHLLTSKHIRNASGNAKNLHTGFACKNCDKIYISRKGLWGHNKICKQIINAEPEENNIIKPSNSSDDINNMITMLTDIMKTNNNFFKQMSELINANNQLINT